MRGVSAIARFASTVVVALLLLVDRTLAQQQMPDGSMPMMGWPMMLAMGLFWVLLLVLMVLTIFWLIKQLRK